MARKPVTLAGDDGKPFTLVIDKFGKGVMTLFDESRLPNDAVYQAQNMLLDQDGIWVTRPGTADYGATLTGPTDGGTSFTKYNTDGTTETYIAVIDNGAFKYSTDGGSWTTVSGKTWTTGHPVKFAQDASRVYIANGMDTIAYYDIAGGTLTTFSSISTPGSIVAPTRTGLTTGSYNAYYKITAVNGIGETAASSEVSVSGGINKKRDDWTTGTDYLSLSWGAVTGATAYNIYYSDAPGTEIWLDSVPTGTTSYVDTGTATPNPYQEAPTTDTTAGPKYGDIALSGNRMFMTKDPTKPYRVAWTGTGQYHGSFNPFYGGGYIDLELGGNERPEKVTHFRDGRGNAVATVLTSDPNGTGSTWHVSLTTLTVDTLSIVIPQAYKQQGSVGTKSPRGVIEYNNSIYFPSPKGFQSLGSQQSILNVLVTTDISSNIRTSVRSINNAQASSICGYASNGRLYWSVPFGSSTNNQIWIMDIERRGAWALPWNIGVKQFFEYTDSSGVIRLLAIPTTGTKLIQFTEGVSGDSGQAFSTNLLSGLLHFNDDHTQWAYVDKVYCEIAQPNGSITFSVSGTQKGKTFQSLGDVTIADATSDSGFSADLWGDITFGDSAYAPSTYTQSSVIKFIRIRKLVNNLRWQFSTNGTNDSYKLLQIVIKGTILPTSDPSQWKRGATTVNTTTLTDDNNQPIFV